MARSLKSFDMLERKLLKDIGRFSKKTSRPILRSIKSQIRKKKVSNPGDIVRKRSGKFRKTFAARTRFRGAYREKAGVTPVMKLKPWTPIANVLLSSASGKKWRKLKYPPESEWDSMAQSAWKMAFDKNKKALALETKHYLFGKKRQKMGGKGPLIIEYLP